MRRCLLPQRAESPGTGAAASADGATVIVLFAGAAVGQGVTDNVTHPDQIPILPFRRRINRFHALHPFLQMQNAYRFDRLDTTFIIKPYLRDSTQKTIQEVCFSIPLAAVH